MNILMLIAGIVFIILGIGSLFRKRNMGQKSSPRYAYQTQARVSQLFIPIIIGIIIIAIATE